MNGDKDMAITDMVTNGYSTDRLEAEIAGCEGLCANCHRKEHVELPDVAAVKG
ncbi:hypothetical protein [Halorhabdus rudnickae]|uniref:hypothetical protein n=1 Tax=Halorhabdus rudnickae TaxID=1775544 RepID=UPI001FCF19FF|nr:hypothetical protein [Halorhabdus rudnickae]